MGEFSVLLGKVFILMVTGFLSYVYMEQELGDCTNPDKPCVNSLIGPTLFVMILAYFIADMFCSIYSMAIDCIMHCYLVDHEVNEEGAKRYHNKDHLKSLVSVSTKREPGKQRRKGNPLQVRARTKKPRRLRSASRRRQLRLRKELFKHRGLQITTSPREQR